MLYCIYFYIAMLWFICKYAINSLYLWENRAKNIEVFTFGYISRLIDVNDDVPFYIQKTAKAISHMYFSISKYGEWTLVNANCYKSTMK